MDSDQDYLKRRVRDVIAVTVEDIDTISVDVENGIVYIEGAVESDEVRKTICRATGRLEGVCGVISCLVIEHVLPPASSPKPYVDRAGLPCPACLPVFMHYSLS
jgi:hypothetical protein